MMILILLRSWTGDGMSGISTSFRPAYGRSLIPVGITVKVGGEMPKVMHFSLGRGREKTFGREQEVQPGSAQLAR